MVERSQLDWHTKDDDVSNDRSRDIPGGWHMGKVVASVVAAGAAIAIFLLDIHAGMQVSYAVLYPLVIVMGALGSGRGVIAAWVATCTLLAATAYAVVHGGSLEQSSLLRFALALLVIGTTAAIMWSRLRIQQVTAELHRSRRELRAVSDSIPQVLWGTSADGRCDFLNERYAEVTGIRTEEAIRNQTWASPIHPDDRPEMYKVWREAIETGSTEFRAYGRVLHSDGTYRWMHSVGRSVRASNGDVQRWYGSLLDVDDEFRAQATIQTLNEELARLVAERTAQLAHTEWRFRNLFDDVNIGVIEQDLSGSKRILDGLKSQGIADLPSYLRDHPEFVDECWKAKRCVDSNATLLRMLGYPGRDEVENKPPREHDKAAMGMFKHQLQAIFEGSAYANGTTSIVGYDDNAVSVAYSVNLREDGMCYITLFDISEKEKAHELMLGAQQELARANRVATVGAMSVSLAHELNQPIWSMSLDLATSIRTISSSRPDYELLRQLLERLVVNSRRLGDIVQSTREKVTARRRSIQAVDLVDLVRETRAVIEPEASSRRALLSVVVEDFVPMVSADRIELQQVLVNLIVNALDAVSEQPPDRRAVEVVVASDGSDRVRVRVEDTGTGVPEESLKRIFEPFYTTKGNGIGMGLQICRDTIEALDGKLMVSNRPEGGARFEFTLPVADPSRSV